MLAQKIETKINYIHQVGAQMKHTIKKKFNIDLDNADYKKLDAITSKSIRGYYESYLNQITLDPSKPLYTHNGIKLSEGFERVVIGDYGAYIEYDLSQVPKGEKYIYETGEEYRVQPYWRNRVKYIWYTTEQHDCKIYWQLKTVSYADYKTKKFFVSPYEIMQ